MLLYPNSWLSKFERNKFENECFYGLPEKVVFVKIALTAIKSPIQTKNINMLENQKPTVFR